METQREVEEEKTILEIVDLEWFKIVEELFYWWSGWKYGTRMWLKVRDLSHAWNTIEVRKEWRGSSKSVG